MHCTHYRAEFVIAYAKYAAYDYFDFYGCLREVCERSEPQAFDNVDRHYGQLRYCKDATLGNIWFLRAMYELGKGNAKHALNLCVDAGVILIKQGYSKAGTRFDHDLMTPTFEEILFLMAACLRKIVPGYCTTITLLEMMVPTITQIQLWERCGKKKMNFSYDEAKDHGCCPASEHLVMDLLRGGGTFIYSMAASMILDENMGTMAGICRTISTSDIPIKNEIDWETYRRCGRPFSKIDLRPVNHNIPTIADTGTFVFHPLREDRRPYCCG